MYRYEDRQLFLLSNLPVGSSVIIGSSSQNYQSWSIPYPYKQNSSFHYLCGIDQPHFLLVLQKLQRNTVRRCLFMKNKPELISLSFFNLVVKWVVLPLIYILKMPNSILAFLKFMTLIRLSICYQH